MTEDTTTTQPAAPEEGAAAPDEAAAAPQEGAATPEEAPPAPEGGAATPGEGAAPEEYTAAAPPDPDATGAGETSFADAEAPPAGQPKPAKDEPDYLELARRTQADFDNYRKRMARENAAAAQRGAAKLAKELLPALDHLELALKATAGGHEDVVKGFALVHDELIAALERVGIERISPQGEAFDPNEHEAMAQQPSEGTESG